MKIMIESSPNKQRDSEARTNSLLLLSKTFHLIDNQCQFEDFGDDVDDATARAAAADDDDGFDEIDDNGTMVTMTNGQTASFC